MFTRKDRDLLNEAYLGVSPMPVSAPTALGGSKPVIISMDMPGAEPVNMSSSQSELGSKDDYDQDGEIDMAAAELHKIVEYAPKLKEMIQNMPSIEGWVASKITKAADYISSVFHYLDYENSEGGCGCKSNMFNTGHDEAHHCEYAQRGCKCGGCNECI